MRKALLLPLVFLLLLVAPTGLRYLQFYGLGSAERPSPPQFDPQTIQPVPTPPAVEFVDEPQVGAGLVLLDQAHRNQFDLDDISYLDGRLAARGYELLPFSGGDLAAALRPVSAFIVIAPLETFNDAELQALNDFVARGGHLLLIGDPTRYNIDFIETTFSYEVLYETDRIPLNSIANQFDMAYNGDYLYNTLRNEGNFRNILLSDFAESRLTDGVERIAFYGSHSLQLGTQATPLLLADEDTWSSATDRPGGLAVAGLSDNGRVLALGDIQFMTEPYHTVYDNGRFIAQIADFLTEEQPTRRQFELVDFPYFYQNPIDLVYMGDPELGPDAFDEIIELQNAFREVGQALSLTAVPADNHDILYLGLYNQAEDVADILATAGISLTIDPPVLTAAERRLLAEEEEEAEPTEEEPTAVEPPPIRTIQSRFGTVQMAGTSLILLDESDGQRRVILLAASKEGLENTIGRLLDNIPLSSSFSYADCLLQPTFALCPSNVASEAIEAELLTSDTPDEAEADEPVETPDEGDGEDDLGGFDDDAGLQGTVALNETVSGELLTDERHTWLFRDGPAVIDITIASETLDLVLELYNPQGQLIDSVDSGFAGDGESFIGLEADEGEYTILVRDFFGEAGEYSLTVTESEGDGVGSLPGDGRIFLFIDNDGQPLTTGFTSLTAYTTFLSDDHDLTTWIATEDGALDLALLLEHDLLIWDSGDYFDVEGFLGEDTAVIFDYVDAGGQLLITGLSPTLLGGLEEDNLSDIADVEVLGFDAVLSNNLPVGETIPLDDTYPSVITELFTEDDTVGLTPLFLRGANSEETGSFAGIAVAEEDNPTERIVLLLFPLVTLPSDIQATLLTNLMVWYGLG